MLKLFVFLALLSGLIIGGISAYIAWETNEHCQFLCEGIIYWGSVMASGIQWFFISFTGCLLVFMPLYFLFERKRLQQI